MANKKPSTRYVVATNGSIGSGAPTASGRAAITKRAKMIFEDEAGVVRVGTSSNLIEDVMGSQDYYYVLDDYDYIFDYSADNLNGGYIEATVGAKVDSASFQHSDRILIDSKWTHILFPYAATGNHAGAFYDSTADEVLDVTPSPANGFIHGIGLRGYEGCRVAMVPIPWGKDKTPMYVRFSMQANVSTYQIRFARKVIQGGNALLGKKVAWLGTSVPSGTYMDSSYNGSYPYLLSQALGFTLVNTSNAGKKIHTKAGGGYDANGNFSLTKAEYAAAGLTLSTSATNGTNHWFSWENAFAVADVDLWVFDVEPNNVYADGTGASGAAQLADFDFATWTYGTLGTLEENRGTYVGALLYLLYQLYTINPIAKCVFVSWRANAAQVVADHNLAIAKAAHIPFIDLWNNTNFMTAFNLTYYNEGDAVHPQEKGQFQMYKVLSPILRQIAL